MSSCLSSWVSHHLGSNWWSLGPAVSKEFRLPDVLWVQVATSGQKDEDSGPESLLPGQLQQLVSGWGQSGRNTLWTRSSHGQFPVSPPSTMAS